MPSIKYAPQWRTLRAITSGLAADTLLTDYKPADLTAAVLAKTASIAPATAVALRAFGLGDNNDTVDAVLTGFMDPNSKFTSSLGHRLWRGQLILGNKEVTVAPLADGKWGAAAAWREVDTWDQAAVGGYNPAGATRLEVADQEAVLLLPTLGYSLLLLEVAALTGTTGFGVLWRPAAVASIVRTF